MVSASVTVLPSDKPADAPEECPGTDSLDAGKASACDGCPNQQACQSAPRGPDPDLPLVRERMRSVKRKILVLSGKGGVGKSTFTTALGWALAADEMCQTGIMDIDICGPSLPLMLGLADQKLHATSAGWSPLYVLDNLCAMSIGFLLPSSSDAVIWRGPKKNGLIKQFLKDVDWGDLDYLLIDTPPGTSDEHLSIVQYLKESGIDGAVVITTPQEVALQDVRKEIDFCRKVGIKILGVVENMAGFVCPACHGESDIFIPTTGGAAQLCADEGLHLLGQIPLDPRIGKSCDMGVSFLDAYPESPATTAYLDVVETLRDAMDFNIWSANTVAGHHTYFGGRYSSASMRASHLAIHAGSPRSYRVDQGHCWSHGGLSIRLLDASGNTGGSCASKGILIPLISVYDHVSSTYVGIKT